MAVVSAWGKPGAWALDAEAHDAADREAGQDFPESTHQPSADFPSLSAAAATKPTRKKKPPTLSLAEFTSGHPVSHGVARSSPSSASKGLTADELLLLPTGPRERSAEELDRSSRGFGYSSSFGLGRGGPAREEPRRSREQSRDSGPSRADEIDDWGAAKKTAPPSMHERRERSSGFFDSASRADESDSWVSRRSAPSPPDGRRVNGGFDGPRERRGGFEMFNREGMDSETWGRKREETTGSREGMDSETWGRKREETTGSSGERRRLVLQPRTLPLASGNGSAEHKEHQPQQQLKSKGSSPFGEARPREEVLAEKGQDWKKINEKLETVKIRDSPLEGGGDFGRKGFGMGNGSVENATERTWRKAEAADVPPLRAEKSEEAVPDN